MNFIKLRGEDGKWHDVFILNGEIMLPISVGDGENSLLMAGAKRALADNCVAIGPGSTAGRMAYYIKAIDTKNYRIYLSNEQVNPPACVETKGSDIEYDTTFEAPAYEVGDEFSIIWNSHYNFIGKIVKIVNNVVWYDSWCAIPEPTVDEWEGEGAFTFHVPSKPDIGVVKLGVGSLVAGEGNKGNGRNIFMSGLDNTGSGDFGLIGGKGNKGGFGVLIGGTENTIIGNNSLGACSGNTVIDNNSGAIGKKNVIKPSKNKAPGSSNFSIGNNNQTTDSNETFTAGGDNLIEGENLHTVGDKNTTEGKQDVNIGFYNKNKGTRVVTVGIDLSARNGTTEQTIIGRSNEPDADASLIIADGSDEKGPHNAIVVKKSGEIVFNGSALVDANGNKYVSKAYVDEQIAALRAELSKG